MHFEKLILENFFGITALHASGLVDPSFWNTMPHSHEHCEVFFLLRGEMDIFVEQNFYHVQERTVRFYASGELHCGHAEGPQEMEWYQLCLPVSFLRHPDYKPLGAFLQNKVPGVGNVFVPCAFSEMVRLLQEAFYMHERRSPLEKQYFQSGLIKVLCLLNETERFMDVEVVPDQRLKEILRLVHQHYREIGTVEDLCRMSHYSPSYLYQLIEKGMNMTPRQLIMGKKINEAKMALKEGRNVTEACEIGGFPDYNYFITVFKKYVGMTPRRYALSEGPAPDTAPLD